MDSLLASVAGQFEEQKPLQWLPVMARATALSDG
jgi:hypothetical protein